MTEDFRYPWDSEPVDAVFFTHYHGDHVGRIMDIPENIPLYIGETARKIMINIQEALSGIKSEESKEHKKELGLLKDDSRIRTFHYNGHFYDHIKDIPGFVVEPYSVDHSAYDAYMFLIEAADDSMSNGKKVILHTGDFRGHGRRGKAMPGLIKHYILRDGKRQVNTLITEGTMMSRMDERVISETEMMREATKYLREHKYAFLICSSTNLDSLASFNQANKMAASPYRRNLYTYNNYYKVQLETFSATAGTFSDIYKFDKVYTLLNLEKPLYSDKWEEPMLQKELMEKYGFLAIIKPIKGHERFIDPFVEDYKVGKIDQLPVIIYSMWDGYVREYNLDKTGAKIENPAKNQDWIDFLKSQAERGIEIKHLHTSGHAEPKMLADVINAVAPTDEIIPMHTEHPELFAELPIKDELKSKIRLDESVVKL